jgi:soluble lytic murein transglycosylase-like protein
VRLALAAYNAVAGRWSAFKGVPPFVETRALRGKVLNEYRQAKASRADD